MLHVATILAKMLRSEQLWRLKFAETFLEAHRRFGLSIPACSESKVWLSQYKDATFGFPTSAVNFGHPFVQ